MEFYKNRFITIYFFTYNGYSLGDLIYLICLFQDSFSSIITSKKYSWLCQMLFIEYIFFVSENVGISLRNEDQSSSVYFVGLDSAGFRTCCRDFGSCVDGTLQRRICMDRWCQQTIQLPSTLYDHWNDILVQWW